MKNAGLESKTIKLNLSINVFLYLVCFVPSSPFDGGEKMRPRSVSRQSVSSRKGSVYGWTAPNTPSFTEKYYLVSKVHKSTANGVTVDRRAGLLQNVKMDQKV